jgi:hypothetical protein
MSKRIRKTGQNQPATPNKIQSNVPLPSKVGCDTCINNMNNENYNCSLDNEHLSSKEKIESFTKMIYKYERISLEAIANEVVKLKRLKQIEVDKVEKAEAARAQKSKTDSSIEDGQKKVFEKTTFVGLKAAFVKQAAHFYFNINNQFGLHLSEAQIPHIANMLCDNFKASNGKFLDLKQTKIGLKLGLSMDKKGDVFLN